MAISFRGSETGAKTQNTEFFGTDITPGGNNNRCSLIRVELALSAAVTLEYTKNSGTTWILALNGDTIAAETGKIFDIVAYDTHTINFRIPTAGGATIREFEVYEVQ